jgi:hypothetical protein
MRMVSLPGTPFSSLLTDCYSSALDTGFRKKPKEAECGLKVEIAVNFLLNCP